MKKVAQKQIFSAGYLLAVFILIALDKGASQKDFAAYLLAAPSVLEQLEKGKEKKR